jgi:DNA gyrase subunit B
MVLEEHFIVREHLRKRPGMYLGTTGPKGIANLIYEVIGNPIDLFLQSQVSTIDIQLTERGVTVTDDGPGFPFEAIGPDGETPFVEYHCTRYHNSPTAVGQVPHIHMTNFNGIGLAAVAAACQDLHIQSHRQGQLWEQRFIQGEPVRPAQVIGPAAGKGSIVQITFDQELFQQSEAVFQDITSIRNIVHQGCLETVYLFPGLTIQLGKSKFFSEHGLLELAQREYPSNHDREVFFRHITTARFTMQAVAIGRSKGKKPHCKAWVNGARMVDEGTHVEAFRSTLKQVKYQPQAIYMHVIMLEPEFAGPMKTALDVPHLRNEMEDRLFEALTEWRKEGDLPPRHPPKGFKPRPHG